MLIDTNIFLGVFLSQAKVNDCLNFLEKLDRGELQGFVTDFTIHGIAVVLERAGQEDFLCLKCLLRSQVSRASHCFMPHC
jgi:predicted nucleic acid-binding protein